MVYITVGFGIVNIKVLEILQYHRCIQVSYKSKLSFINSLTSIS